MGDVDGSDNTYRETFNYVLESGFDEDQIIICWFGSKAETVACIAEI